MVHYRVQGSDFQNSGLKGNLKKFKVLADVSNKLSSKGSCSLDLVGDFNDMHSIDELVNSHFEDQFKQKIQEDPDLVKVIEENNSYVKDLMTKYNVSEPQNLSSNLDDDEKSKLELLQKKVQKSFPRQDLIGAINSYYSKVNGILDGVKNPIYGVRGNNDHNKVQDYLTNVNFTDLKSGFVTDNNLTIIGANNTNYAKEIALPKKNVFACDDSNNLKKSQAYQRLNLKKLNKKADIIQLHGPVDGFRSGKDSGFVGIPKLIKEHNPQLVECGHFHKSEIKVIDGVTHIRSSPKEYFIHEFDDKNNYQGSWVCKY